MKLQDGRVLRRYRRRWKVERTFAWLQNFRRLVTRYERKASMFLAFVHVACLFITLRASLLSPLVLGAKLAAAASTAGLPAGAVFPLTSDPLISTEQAKLVASPTYS
jgi:hypothetical protein